MSQQDVEDIYELSPLQQGLLFHHVAQPNSGFYLVQTALELEGELDAPAFRAAWATVLRRHPALRASFHWQGGLEKALQVVHRGAEAEWTVEDWRADAPAAHEARLGEFLRADRARGFDPARAPLLRFALFRTGERAHRFVVSGHHLLLDGWSKAVMLSEAFRLYYAAREERDAVLPPARPYREYLAWLQARDAGQAERFWRGALAGFSEATPLPVARPAAGHPDAAAFGEERVPLPAESAAALQAAARAQGVTLNTVFQGAWALLLSRYSGHDDVVFGATVSGRPAELEGVERMVGMFINTIPVRATVPAEMPVGEWLRALQAGQAAAREYDWASLAQVQGWSGVPRGTPLFETLLVYENYPPPQDSAPAAEHRLSVRGAQGVERGHYLLSLLVLPGRELVLKVVHDGSRISAEAVRGICGHLRVLLEAFAAAPETRLGDLPMLAAEERTQVIQSFNATAEPFTPRTFPALVAERAAAEPGRTAVELGDASLTYAEVEAGANRLARHLRALGVTAETRVAVCLERGMDLPVAVLGVMKAGGCAVPLDPAYPAARLGLMLADSGAGVVVTTAALLATLPPHDARAVCLDRDAAEIAAHPAEDPAIAVDVDQLAYVIFTSGSTGRPKPVGVPHRGLANTLRGYQRVLGVDADSRVLQFASFSFDAAAAELLMALGSGAALVMAPRERLLPGAGLLELLRERRVTVATLPPSVLALLPEAELPALATLAVAGEACPPALAARWSAGRRFVNLYGPTEATIWATAGAPAADGTLTIGRPISNVRAYVLDARLRPLPVGVPGELFLGGAGVARGYLGRPGLTAERFVPDAFSGDAGARLYRTGDVARWTGEGTLEFLGRADFQVKVRGFRIEPGEVEAALAAHPALREAVVIAREDQPGDRRLVAYVVAAPGAAAPSTTELRRWAGERLPDYMVPAAIVALDALPLSPNGKVDRRALPAPDGARPELGDAYLAPRTGIERGIAEVWQQVLGVDRVGLNDNFFDLGGNSLLLLQAYGKILKLHPGKLQLVDLFEHPTVRALSRMLDGGGETPAMEQSFERASLRRASVRTRERVS